MWARVYLGLAVCHELISTDTDTHYHESLLTQTHGSSLMMRL